MFSQTVLVGNLTRDAETRQVGENTVANFSIAVSTGRGKNKKTEFYNCNAWNKLAEVIGQYGSKGRLVLAIGELTSREYESKKGGSPTTVRAMELQVSEFKFLDHKQDDNGDSGGDVPAAF